MSKGYGFSLQLSARMVSQMGLRLLADKAVELGYCDHFSHTEVATILKKRTQATSQANLVHREDRKPISGPHGTDIDALCLAF